ncbi:N-acetylgalactosaminyltransferase 7 [Eumeta japonica]|uniref:N-acetylgalactosaminyltransferase 7 n=1 Tax=Eumeta variegata TaxID=151549 RepID=A0A4C1T9C1_EUMVA|nr:N-acetylgalactosaminyltransferase 7 [Eumeta japonica]
MKLNLVPAGTIISVWKGSKRSSCIGRRLGNFEPKHLEIAKGPGENGEAYHMPSHKKNAADESEMEWFSEISRNKEREGLIRTRSRGASVATGEVIVFLDAHCEVNINWLPPLLAPIYRDRTVMTVPIIDGIDYKTFEYRSVYGSENHFRGIFEWGMLYKENEVPKREQRRRQHNSEPYRSPTHAGGLFAINREYFLELGAYDPGLLVWGGENFELSFKIWQCGGSIEWVPCSHVGHVYRGFMPYNFGKLAPEEEGTFDNN